MYSNFLQPFILAPTRIVGNSRPSLIDNIFINTYDKPILSGNFINKISDHMPNFTIARDILIKTKKIKIRDMKNFEEEKYLQDLEKIKNLDLMKYENVNDMYNAFHNKYMEIIDKNAPYRTLSKKESELKLKPWITKSILQSIKIRDNYQKKYIRKQDSFWYKRYRYYRNKINILIKKSKKNYLRKFFQENFNNSKKTWNKINEILNRKRNQMTDIFLSDDGVMITNQKTISNRFNNYYINVAQNLIKEMGESNTEFQDYLKNPNEHSFFLNETTPDETDKHLKNWI